MFDYFCLFLLFFLIKPFLLFPYFLYIIVHRLIKDLKFDNKGIANYIIHLFIPLYGTLIVNEQSLQMQFK